MDSDVGEMERKPSETTEPNFFSVTHFLPVLCTGANYEREILPTSRSLSIIRDRNKLMCKMTTPSSQRKLIIIRAFLLCQKKKGYVNHASHDGYHTVFPWILQSQDLLWLRNSPLNFQQVLWQDLKSAHDFYQLPNVLVYCSIQHLTTFLLSLVKEPFYVCDLISLYLHVLNENY